jgi:hypothetical protein
MRAGRTLPRWLTLAAAVLVVLQLGGVVHLAAAPHGICWEHGVVVELDGAASGVRATPTPVGLAPAVVPVIRADQHPHCPALWVFRQARLQSSARAQPLARIAHGSPVASPPDVAPPSGWALHRAPKQSPPV